MMFLVLILLYLSVGTSFVTDQTEDKLIFTQIIFRHGDRTIRKSYATDPYKDKVYWPEGLGQLTNRGKQRLYYFGNFLRRRYEKFLGNGTFSPDKVRIQSSDCDRTINSANVMLAAFFPPKDQQIWDEHLLWQPIAVHSIPAKSDFLIWAENACERYNKIRLEYEDSAEMKSLREENRDLIEYIEKYAKQPMRTLGDIKDFHGTLLVEQETNKTLPQWTQHIYFLGSKLEYLGWYYLKTLTATNEMKRLRSGFLLKEILDRFRNKTLSQLPDQLMHIYSAHDLTIASMLNTLDLFKIHKPPYASCLLFELYKSNDSHYIQLFYRNSTSEVLLPLNIPHCGPKCNLNQFYELNQNILPTDFDECQLIR